MPVAPHGRWRALRGACPGSSDSATLAPTRWWPVLPRRVRQPNPLFFWKMATWLENWEPRVVKVASEQQLSDILINPGEYCDFVRLSSSRKAQINASIQGKMSEDQAESLRQQMLVEKCKLGFVKIKRKLYQITEAYEVRGGRVVDIARLHDVPPMAVLRAILSARLLSNWQRSVGKHPRKVDDRDHGLKKRHKKMVTEALRGNECALLPLSARDHSELAAASSADAASFEGVDPRQKEIADAFEDVVGKVGPRRRLWGADR